MASTIVVVPCFNEAERLPVAAFLAFAERASGIDFLFVNDGSTDATLEVLDKLRARAPERFSLLDQQPNRGKAEAVRLGMRTAFARHPDFAGYWDADLATPLEEIPAFIEVLERRPESLIVFGSRVRLLGRMIERRPFRHYLGRVFATVASLLLDLPVYDTQCGAKLFRNTPEMASLFEEPFCTNWVFDVELVARLIRTRRTAGGAPPSASIYELPLRCWHDVAGSKVRGSDFVKAVAELARIRRRYL
jgi:dolichyl-phosphate beta-glucosyltransferase